MPEPDEDQSAASRKSGMVYAAITTLVISIIGLLAVGWLLDRWLGTAPWLLVSGLLVGSVLGFYQFIRIMSKMD